MPCRAKIRYPSAAAAAEAVKSIHREIAAGVSRVNPYDASYFRAYRCRECGAFHYGKANRGRGVRREASRTEPN